MSFNVTYPAGGVIDEVKKVKLLLGGIIDEVKNVDNIDKVALVEKLEQLDNVLNVENVNVVNEVKTLDEVNTVKLIQELQKVDLVDTINLLKEIEQLDLINTINELKHITSIDTLDTVNTVKKVEDVNVDTIETVNTVKEVENIPQLKNFPKFTQPYNTMVRLDIPAIEDTYEGEYIIPDFPVELMALTVTCSGYGELDNYDILYNDKEFFKNWYCSEVKEGLYIGTSNMVYSLPANGKLTLKFHNVSGTSKIVWFGIRMLKE